MKPHNDFIKTNKLKQYKRTVLSIPTDEGDSYKLDINPIVQRYRLIHKPKKLVSQAQITTPVVGQEQYVPMGSAGGYGHVILQLESNPDRDGCFLLWSVTPESTPPDMNPGYLLTPLFLDDVYGGLSIN